MKLYTKLNVIQLMLSIALFLVLVLTISVLNTGIRNKNLRISFNNAEISAEKLKNWTFEMTVSQEPTSYLVENYSLYFNDLETFIQTIENDRLFQRLGAEKSAVFEENKEKWRQILGEWPPSILIDALNIREISPMEGQLSLINHISLHRWKQSNPQGILTELEKSLKIINDLEITVSNTESAFSNFLIDILNEADQQISKQFNTLTYTIAAALLLALVLILFLGKLLEWKLLGQLRTLSNFEKGDYSGIKKTGNMLNDELSNISNAIQIFGNSMEMKLQTFLTIMQEISETFEMNMETSNIEKVLLQQAMKDSNADGAAIYTILGDEGELILSSLSGRYHPPFKVENIPDNPEYVDIEALLRGYIIMPNKTILGESAKKGKVRFIKNVSKESNIDWNREVKDELYISSIIIIPLKMDKAVFGILVINKNERGRYFTDHDFNNMLSFGELIAITLDNIHQYTEKLEASQLNRELEIAMDIQENLLPKRLPTLPNCKIAHFARNVKGLNGDYFEGHPLGEHKIMLSICEVAGRGIAAGLIMIMIRTILRLLTDRESDAVTIMDKLNLNMTSKIALENYASVGIFVIDSDGKFSCSSASHFPFYVYRAGNKDFETLQSTGIPIGVDQDTQFKQIEGQLNKNDLILLHSDGIADARNISGQFFGIESLLRHVQRKADTDPQEIVEYLKFQLESFEHGSQQSDDQTLIILKYTGGETS